MERAGSSTSELTSNSSSPDGDGELYLDSDILYNNLASHYQFHSRLFSGLVEDDFQVESSKPAEIAQNLRTSLAIRPFFEQSNSDINLASLGGWNYDAYEKYAELMDGPLENGGLNNYLETIQSKLKDNESLPSTWLDPREDVPVLPTDAEIEGKILPSADFVSSYQMSIRNAYKKVQEKQQASKKMIYPKPAVKRDSSASKLPSVSGSLPLPPEKAKPSAIRNDSKNILKDEDEDMEDLSVPVFRTAKAQHAMNNVAQNGETAEDMEIIKNSSRNISENFRPPVARGNKNLPENREPSSETANTSWMNDVALKNLDPRMVEDIMSRILHKEALSDGNTIAGLQYVKDALSKRVIWPLRNPKLCTGLMAPPKGLLLFGPPGTGKTLIGRWIASSIDATFFSVSASNLTSKWVGESEKMVRTLFQVARSKLPAIIFIDEIDSLLGQRGSEEHDSSRRMKTEFLVQMDGIETKGEEILLVIGATNRPEDLDDAFRRRFAQRIHIPLPPSDDRKQIVKKKLLENAFSLSEQEFQNVADRTEGFSGSDLDLLCRDACHKTFDRFVNGRDMDDIQGEPLPPIEYVDFLEALKERTPSVSQKDLQRLIEWNNQFGTGKK